jgi:predicted transposase YdaD
MMRLPAALSRKFEQELAALEESLNMPYVTSVERIAEERGEARGKAEGSANILLKLLASRFGPLPAAVERRIRQLPLERLEAMAEAIFEFGSVKDVRVWLDAHQKSTR